MSLVVMHRAAMDVRCPYFDYDLIDFVYELPRAVRVNPRLRWQIMDLRLRPLTRIPHDRDWRLPVVNPVHRAAHSLRTRAIARFNRLVYPAFPLPDTLYADYESYLRTDLRTWAQDLLLSPRALDRGLFAPDAVRALWERHLGGRELWTIGKIAPLMTIELFLRAFVD
jgi:asparagine synthase (glutamine-hydrolysing)